MKLAANIKRAAGMMLAIASLGRAGLIPAEVTGDPPTEEGVNNTFSQLPHLKGLSKPVINKRPDGGFDVTYNPKFPNDGFPIKWFPMCHRFDVDLINREYMIKIAGVPPEHRNGMCNRLWQNLKHQIPCGVSFKSAIHACGTDVASGEFFWQFEVAHGCSRTNVQMAYHYAVGFGFGELICQVGERQNGQISN